MKSKRTIAVAAACSLALAAVAANSQPVATPLFHAKAFGSRAGLGEDVLVDPSAAVTIRCGADYSDSVASDVDGGDLYQIQQVSNVVAGFEESELLTTTSRSEVHGVSLLGGLVTASALTAVSRTTWSDGVFRVGSDGTSFDSLSVNGLPVPDGDIRPNTRLPLPGVGFVVVNEQVQDMLPGSASLLVNMLRVVMTVDGSLGQAGTEIVVGFAISRLEHTSGALSGYAYGTSTAVPGGESSGASALVDMPCGGTDGRLLAHRMTGLDAWPAVTSGMIANTAVGLTGSDFVLGETTSAVRNVDLFDGRVQVENLTVSAGLNASGEDLVFAGDTSFKGLVIDGLGMPYELAPNTVVYLPGIGDLSLNRQVVGEDERSVTQRLTVKALEILVTETNPLGLPIGTRVEVGVASVALAQ